MVWPSKLRTLILEKSEGNPFFLEEVVRTLINDGIVRQDGESEHWYTTAEVEEFVVPGSLQALMAARFDKLTEENRQIMQLASVIGRPSIIPIFDNVAGNGNNADCTIVKFAGVRIVEVDMSGSASSKRVMIQPAWITTDKGIEGGDSQTSDFIYSKVLLVR